MLVSVIITRRTIPDFHILKKGTEEILKSWNANIFDDVTAQLMSVAMLHGSCNEVLTTKLKL